VVQKVNAQSGAKGKLNAMPEDYRTVFTTGIIGDLETREIPGVQAEASKTQDEQNNHKKGPQCYGDVPRFYMRFMLLFALSYMLLPQTCASNSRGCAPPTTCCLKDQGDTTTYISLACALAPTIQKTRYSKRGTYSSPAVTTLSGVCTNPNTPP